MPLPRYQPLKKKPKIEGFCMNDLDDYCLSKIIGYALLQASSRANETAVCDTSKTERNLSLVSRRWHFLTQIQVGAFGVHRINLDRISRSPRPASSIASVPSVRKPTILMQRNVNTRPRQNLQAVKTTTEDYDIILFRYIKAQLFKYKNLIIEGTLTCSEFNKLVATIEAARVEQLHLKVEITKDKSLAKEFGNVTRHLNYLERLILTWNTSDKRDLSNALTWTVYERAIKLKKLEINLIEQVTNDICSNNEPNVHEREAIDKLANKYIFSRTDRMAHQSLVRIVFNRTHSDPDENCCFTSLMKTVLVQEDSIQQVDTNDSILIEHLIKSSDRICTSSVLKRLKFLAPIRSLDLLSQLMESRTLGTERLSIVIDNIDQIETVRHCIETFATTRHDDAACQLCLHLKDQKIPDCEDKIKNLVYLSRLAEVTVYINAQQRISIDCCHLMWSVGRALHATSGEAPSGRCLFKVTVQGLPFRMNPNNYSEITIPFGHCLYYKINSSREDPTKHRDILKSLKQNCYHQFVKAVRENVTS